jgi:hypothetical protein
VDYTLSVEPGETIEVKACFGYIAPKSSLPEEKLEIIIGLEDSPRLYLIAGLEYAHHLGGHDYVRIFEFTVPKEPGIYHFCQVSTKGYTCDGAEKLYMENPSARKVIGTIEVIEDDDSEPDEPDEPDDPDERTCRYNELHYIEDKEMGTTICYTIKFWQSAGNIIEAEISSENRRIYDGSIAITYIEEMNLDFSTGDVWLRETKNGAFVVDERDRMANWVKKTALLMSSIIFPVGYAKSIIDYINAMFGVENMKYTEDNRAGDATLSYYFEDPYSENHFDTTVLPWSDSSGGYQMVRILCPVMLVYKTREYVMFYRITFRISNSDTGFVSEYVCNDIALPLNFTVTGTTDDLPIKRYCTSSYLHSDRDHG